jgi:pantoate--beta-alanine ligase
MEIIRSVRDLAPFQGARFVPTMGALHAGHRALIAAARAGGGAVLVSIFVNPMQFGPTEDLERYPRPLDEDLAICREEGVDAVFLPEAETIYPPGFATRVAVPSLAGVLCGAHRPGHFEGVATVVARLFGLVRPSHAFFGWKDAQQFLIIRRLADDLYPEIEIIGVPTVREPDGLALSSRNRYLDAEARRRAARFPEALRRGLAAIEKGEPVGRILDTVRTMLVEAAIETEYIELRRLDDLGEIPPDRPLGRPLPAGGVILAAAVRIQGTRLIDNLRLDADGVAR